jgi:murein DD-endopeptidase MepM/ murein hydrolase activator NlpD
MVNPVPGSTPKNNFHARGPLWKTCGVQTDAKKHKTGLHTGNDFPAPDGTKVVAARAGVVRHVTYGAAFGTHQVAVRCPDGTEDFYAHMSSRVADGLAVKAGDKVGAVGHEGNVKGSHLHFERHTTHGPSWSCGFISDPAPSVAAGVQAHSPAVATAKKSVRLSQLRFGIRGSTSVSVLQAVLLAHRRSGDPVFPVTGNYLGLTDQAVRLCQQRHAFGHDPTGTSFIGPKQAVHLFGTTVVIVDDR